MNMDLNTMSRQDLLKLRGDVEKALANVADRERKAALQAAEDAAAKYGFSLSELTALSSAKPGRGGKAKSPAKYRNPSNGDETWSGRGRKPRWIVEAESAGRNIADFAI